MRSLNEKVPSPGWSDAQSGSPFPHYASRHAGYNADAVIE
jgi:hypothetical protein